MLQLPTSSKESNTSECEQPILCFYTNITSRIQILRIRNILNLHFERVIFPGERLMFEAMPEAKLEVFIWENITVLIPCKELRVISEPIFTQPYKSDNCA